MVSVYALLCAATLLRVDCTPATAIDVVRMPDADNQMACLMGSMMTLARLAIQPHPGEYWKIVCAEDAAGDDGGGGLPAYPAAAAAPPATGGPAPQSSAFDPRCSAPQ
jgi:hypothetical protein